MAGYDPKRPRPTSDADAPAPVEAIIDLADGRGPVDPDAPGESEASEHGADATTAHVETASGAPDRTAAIGAPGDAGTPAHADGRSSVVIKVVVAAALITGAVALLVMLRRRRA